MVARRRTCRRAGGIRAVVVVLATGACAWAWAGPVRAQPQRFELFVAAVDDRTQRPATDLTAADLLVTEQGEAGRVVRVERYSLPVRLTILVDNGSGLIDLGTVIPDPPAQGPGAQLPPRADMVPLERRGAFEALVHVRRGLEALIDTLPADLEVDILALAPNPRFLARPTSDRARLLRGVQLLTPEDQFPSRFSDGLVEYGKRLDRDLRGEHAVEARPYVPVLVALGSNGFDGSQPRRDDVREMLEAMVRYGVRTHFAILTRHAGPLAVNTGSQVLVAKEVQELTGGAYVSLAVPTRAATLLPEWGAQIAFRHRVGTSQYRVTIERPAGATGPLSELGVFVRRAGYSGIVTVDGRVP